MNAEEYCQKPFTLHFFSVSCWGSGKYRSEGLLQPFTTLHHPSLGWFSGANRLFNLKSLIMEKFSGTSEMTGNQMMVFEVEAYLEENFEFRRNVVSGKTEYRTINCDEWITGTGSLHLRVILCRCWWCRAGANRTPHNNSYVSLTLALPSNRATYIDHTVLSYFFQVQRYDVFV